MPENTPTPAAAAATPAVQPLTQEEIEALRSPHPLAGRSWGDEVVQRLLASLDAAVAQRDAAVRDVEILTAFHNQDHQKVVALEADLAEFARQTREAQAAIKDKEQERKRADSEAILHQTSQSLAEDSARRWHEQETATERERQRADAAEACLPSAHELTDNNRALQSALAAERQAREQAEAERDKYRHLSHNMERDRYAEWQRAERAEESAIRWEASARRAEAALAAERARGERLAPLIGDAIRAVAMFDSTRDASGLNRDCKLSALELLQEARDLLAAPAAAAELGE